MKRFMSIVTILCVMAGMVTACSKSIEKLTGSELLDLGEKYLLEMNYDEAIVVFDRLIEVEPRNPRGYLGVADAYIGMSEIELAKAILRQGIDVEEMTPENRAQLQALFDKLVYEEQREEATTVATPILEEIAMLCSNEQYEAIFKIMQTSDYEKITVLEGYLNEPFIINTQSGKIGVYGVDSEWYGNYMIYYGGYDNNIRKGAGLWFGYYEGNSYFAKGDWANDKPNGSTQAIEGLSVLSENSYYTTITGNVVNGLWDGEVTYLLEWETEPPTVYPVQYNLGRCAVVEIDKEQDSTRYVVSKLIDSSGDTIGRLSFDKPDKIRGIIGFLE